MKQVRYAEDAARLPASISAKALGKDLWRCTFRFRPATSASSVVLAGSFNGWDRQALSLKGPNSDGEWVGDVDLGTGVYEYKFLVNDEKWFDDPVNLDRVPDGFGGHNSFLRLGQLASMKTSEAKVGDGEIDAVGLAHRPPLPLFVQPTGADRVSIRYRTMSNDIEHVWLAVHGGSTTEMQAVSTGPLFTYWEAEVAAPARENGRTRGVHSLEYTFVLEDGQKRAGDPYTYRFTFPEDAGFTTPEWAKNAVWYQIMIDRFRDGDTTNDPDPVRPWTSAWFEPSPWETASGDTFYNQYVFNRFYGGDLAGLEQELPYLKALGISAIYLNPVFKAPTNHKYDVQNHLHIDDGFGKRGDYDAVAAQEDLLDPSTWGWTETDKQFLALLKKAHEMGFRVVIDGVFNHVGVEHPAFKDVEKNGRASRFADWFDVTSWEPFRYKGWADFTHMPVLRKSRDGFASEHVKDYIFAVTRRWMDPNGDGDPSDGIDGWRLDVPHDVPRPFWVEWRGVVKSINPDALITGEIWHRADQWLDGHSFDAVMNYEFARVAVSWVFDRQQKIGASEAAARLAELRLAYPAVATYTLQNVVDSHDTDRIASMAHNPDRQYDRQNRLQDSNPNYDSSKPSPEDYAKARLVALLQMTYVGAPMVYYGDEAGMWGADDPSSRKPMLWKDLQPYDDPQDVVMEDQLAFYIQAIALRNEHSALRTGTFESLLTDDAADAWVFLRSDGIEHVLVALSASAEPHKLSVPLPDGLPEGWKVIFGEPGSATAADGSLTIDVPAMGGVVFAAPAK